MRKLTPLLLLLLLLIPTATAKQPQETTFENVPVLQIAYPKNDYFMQGYDVDLHFHVHNSSGHLLTNETTDCQLQVYNHTGRHILETGMLFDSNGQHFYYEVNTNLIASPYNYGYIIWCNSSSEAGFLSGAFQVADGKDLEGTGIAIILIMVFVVAYYFIMTKVVDVDDDFMEMLRMFWIMASMPLIWLLSNTALLIGVANEAPSGVQSMLSTFYRVNVWILYFTIAMVLLFFAYKLFTMFKLRYNER